MCINCDEKAFTKIISVKPSCCITLLVNTMYRSDKLYELPKMLKGSINCFVEMSIENIPELEIYLSHNGRSYLLQFSKYIIIGDVDKISALFLHIQKNYGEKIHDVIFNLNDNRKNTFLEQFPTRYNNTKKAC